MKSYKAPGIIVTAICLIVAAAAITLFFRDLNGTLTQINEQAVGTVIMKDKVVQRHFRNRLVWDQLREDSVVYSGDTVRTSALSGVSIVFNNNDNIDLGENSMVQIFFGEDGATVDISGGSVTAKSAEGSTGLTLVSGDKRVVVVSGSEVKAAVPVAPPETAADPATNAGTDTNAAPAQNAAPTFEVQVISGSAQMESPGEEKMELQSGAAVSVSGESVVPPPETIVMPVSPLSGESISSTQTGDIETTLSWRLSGKAVTVRVEISPGRRFDNITQKLDVPSDDGESSVKVKLAPGVWWWRVYPEGQAPASANRFSLEYAPPEVKPEEAAAPVILSSPRPGASFTRREDTPVLSWTSNVRPFSSRIIVSREDNPIAAAAAGSAVFELSNAVQVPLPDLPEGTYYWTVEATSPAGENMNAASPSYFVILPQSPLPSPRLLRPADNNVIDAIALGRSGSVNLAWSAVSGADAYIVTVWKDGRREPIVNNPPSPGRTFSIEEIVKYGGGAFIWQAEAVAVDSDGRVIRRGEIARHRFVLDVKPPDATELIE